MCDMRDGRVCTEVKHRPTVAAVVPTVRTANRMLPPLVASRDVETHHGRCGRTRWTHVHIPSTDTGGAVTDSGTTASAPRPHRRRPRCSSKLIHFLHAVPKARCGPVWTNMITAITRSMAIDLRVLTPHRDVGHLSSAAGTVDRSPARTPEILTVLRPLRAGPIGNYMPARRAFAHPRHGRGDP